MLDIETTGMSKDHNAIIQLVAVRFDPIAKTIDHNFFDQCMIPPTTRFWDDGTRDWWLNMPEILKSIYVRMQEPSVVMRNFYDWCGGAHNDLYTWAKPLSFDVPFVESYFREFGPMMCLDHRRGRDLRTFLAGLSFPNPPMDDMAVPFTGDKHNALHDVLHQIKILFQGLEE